MPVIKCNAITAHGFCCTNKAKPASEKCNMHKNSENEKSLHYLQKRANFIVKMDISRRIINPVNLFAEAQPRTPETIARAIALVEAQEALVRVDYPAYGGQFSQRREYYIIQSHRQYGARGRAEDRVPLQLKFQIPLMHEWFDYLYTRIDRARIFVLRDDLYDEQHVTESLRLRLAFRWNDLDNDLQVEIFRAFRNLTILGQDHIGVLVAGLEVRPQPELQAFRDDAQNVHRTATVSYIKQMFDTLMTIDVPINQKTLGLVFTHCTLSDAAIMQTAKFYTEGIDIYEISMAYTRALDSVVAYIEKQTEKTELYNRVSQELTDNEGMCAQGNLSRICNILSGYIDGIEPPISKNEMMQNKISVIAMDSEANKIERAKAYMREIEIPEAEWGPWIEAIEAF